MDEPVRLAQNDYPYPGYSSRSCNTRLSLIALSITGNLPHLLLTYVISQSHLISNEGVTLDRNWMVETWYRLTILSRPPA